MILNDNDKPSLDYLAHYGVKGMHWGVHRDRDARTINVGKHKFDEKKVKKAAIIGGVVIAAAALTVGAAYASKHMDAFGSTRLRDIPVPSDSAKKFTEKIIHEPVDVIHASRVKSRGFQFLKNGGIPQSVLREYETVFGADSGIHGSDFRRYGDRLEKIAVRFPDPLGRKDFAGRVIPHEVIIPAHLAKGIKDKNEAIQKAWDLVKDNYQKHWDADSYHK